MKRKGFNSTSGCDRMNDETDDTASCLSFEVLYYPKSSSIINKNGSNHNKKKRKKNPKNSQDGILHFRTISNQLELRCLNSDGDDNASDDDKDSNHNSNNKNINANIVYNNGCSNKLAKRLTVLCQQKNIHYDDEDEDSVISFGPWECQIISRLNTSQIISSSIGNSNKHPLERKNILSRPSSINRVSTKDSNSLSGLSKYSLSKRKQTIAIRRPLVSSSKKVNSATSMGSNNDTSPMRFRKPLVPSATPSFQENTEQNDVSIPASSSVESSTHKTSPRHTILNNNISSKLSSHKYKKITSSSFPLKINRATLTSSSKRIKRPSLHTNAPIRKIVQPSSVSHHNANKNDVKSNMIIPPSIRQLLRPHQQKGIQFLWKCITEVNNSTVYEYSTSDNNDSSHKMTKGAILADEMGLGKTLMTISIIFALHRKARHNRFVVVCPSSLVGNWSKEFDKWLGKASQPKRVVIQKGGEATLALLRAFVPSKPPQMPGEVLIISYEMFRMNAPNLLCKTKNVGLLVVDEGHRLKNSKGSLTLSALNSLQDCEAKLLITGTPIQNNLSEFYNIANFVRPGIFGNLGTFRKDYERPISLASHKNATQQQILRAHNLSKELDAITSTFMLRRLQKDILKNLLPPRSEILMFCKPSLVQRKIYKDLTKDIVTTNGRISSTCSADSLMLLTKVRKLCSHPHLLKQISPDHSSGDTGFDNQYDNKNSHLDNQHDVSLSGKLSVLDSLLQAIRERCPTDKVIVISNFTSALSIIEETIITQRGWSCLRLDGSIAQSTRQTLVDSFNRTTPEKSFVFLLSSKAGGCGLNLIGANRLIMFDPDWNPAIDMQAMARVYREGQTKPCFIYRFFTSGTVEEVIFQRQTQKSHLDCLTIDDSSQGDKRTKNKNKNMMHDKNKSSNCFTKEELRDCFTLKEECDCDTKNKLGSGWGEYNGLETLQQNGFNDAPLFQVVKNNEKNESDIGLAYVHMVNNKEAECQTDVSESDNIEGRDDLDPDDDGSSFGDKSTSTEEAEFDD